VPIAFDPNATRHYVLRADRTPQSAIRNPQFLFRYQTRRAKAAYLSLGADPSVAAVEVATVYERLGRVLVGWKGLVDAAGVAIEFDAARLQELLDGVLTDMELWELYSAGASDLDEADRKNFDLQSSSAPDSSASQASAAPAGSA
jgi:hypothetical protein